jgi:hypothetical protein
VKFLRNLGLAKTGAAAAIVAAAAVVAVLFVLGDRVAPDLPQSTAELEARKAAVDHARDGGLNLDVSQFGAQCRAPDGTEESRTWSCSVEPQGEGPCFGTVRIVATGRGSAGREDDQIDCGE